MQKDAAEVILANGYESLVDEVILENGETKIINVTSSMNHDMLEATIAWIDPEGVHQQQGVNDRTPQLVNDIDLRIIQGNEIYEPWVLDPDNPSEPALYGDNVVDNVEKVEVEFPDGDFQIVITHKGTLQGDNNSQNVSVIVSGIDGFTDLDEASRLNCASILILVRMS